MALDILVAGIVASTGDQHNSREWSFAVGHAQRTGELVKAGEIVEPDIPLQIRYWSGRDGIFLGPFMNDWCQVFSSGSFQDELIDLLKCQIATLHLLLLIPDAIVAQVELGHCKMQMDSVGCDLIEGSFITAGVGKMADIARGGPFDMNSDLETAVQLADPIASDFLGKSCRYADERCQ